MLNAKELAAQQLSGNVTLTTTGIKIFTPDGEGSYGAQWTRDLFYMIDDAGDLLNIREIRDALDYNFSHCRASDCWMPDRVNAEGLTWYTADGWDKKGHPLPNLDDNAFAVMATQRYRDYASKEDGDSFLQKWHDTLIKALRATPVDENGLVYNDPERPHSPYGFTDVVCKTGVLSMDSLIQWQAYKIATSWGDTEFAAKAQKVEAVFEETFFPDGMTLPLAATVDCRQVDIWAALYVLAIGFPLSEARKSSLRRAIVSVYDDVVQKGQVCHTLKEPWQKLFEEFPYGTYQNGAYWATPLRWLVQALLPEYPALAKKSFEDAMEDFEKGGNCECINCKYINGDYRKLENFVASATAAYGAYKVLYKN